MKKKMPKFLLTLVVLFCCLTLGACMFLNHPKFGKNPAGERLQQFESSANFSDGRFKNSLPTPTLIDGETTFKIFRDDFFAEKVQTAPPAELPTIKTDLLALDRSKDTVIWLGHSSYFIQLDGKRILIDPVLSAYASPVSFANKAFNGTSIYSADDIPPIDLLLISHDHWDHLDYPTLTELNGKIRRVIVPLGVGSHLESWGYPAEKIREADWFTALPFDAGLTVHVLPARHYSGRLFDNNRTFWASFALQTPQRRLYFGGDSGYGPHFKEIGDRLGPFDLAMLDSGQYDPRWPLIHMTPEQAAQAAVDLRANGLLPMHVGKFSISRHAWDEPFIRIAAASEGAPFQLVTPLIGQPVPLDEQPFDFTRWWEPLR